MNEQRRTIQIVRAALAFFVWMQILPQSIQANRVHIPNPNLRAAVREALNLPADAPVTLAAMQDLTDLGAGERGITDLSGLEFAINLTFLSIPYNPITDLTPIAKLKNLETIYMWATSVSDISPLANLTKLRVLLASYGGEIVDISPLANLTLLETINLSGNKIVDVTPLANLTHLTHLELSANKITDVTPLANLTHLTHLELSANKITDITPLANLTHLTHLTLSSNKIIDITPLMYLTHLTHLELVGNDILDHSPLDGLALTVFEYDQTCDMPPLPLQPRLENRSFPSLFSPWGFVPGNQPHFSDVERMAQHDLYFCCIGMFYGLDHLDTRKGWQVRGNINFAIRQRDEYIAYNPNMVFLTTTNAVWDGLDVWPENSPYWLRDDKGQIEIPYDGTGMLDLNHPEVQQLVVDRVVAIAQCGLYDGVHFDAWMEHEQSLVPGMVAILKGIRERVREDFLILANTNRWKIPASAPYINGSFFESGLPIDDSAHGEDGISRGFSHMEETLLWAEENFRSPQINSFLGFGFGAEPMDSSTNRRYMRAITTLNLTFSDGYFMYYLPGPDGGVDTGLFSGFYWYDFWDANLGHPIGPKSQLYKETDGLYIREFTNGWAVYNHSGEPQIISLPETVQAVASGLLDTEHVLPNLDGEMYLRVKPKNPADVNGDGMVNILDLTLIARGFGTDNLEGDVNGDGVVNVLDLVYVANQF